MAYILCIQCGKNFSSGSNARLNMWFSVISNLADLSYDTTNTLI